MLDQIHDKVTYEPSHLTLQPVSVDEHAPSSNPARFLYREWQTQIRVYRITQDAQCHSLTAKDGTFFSTPPKSF